jgi:hypothetical protein
MSAIRPKTKAMLDDIGERGVVAMLHTGDGLVPFDSPSTISSTRSEAQEWLRLKDEERATAESKATRRSTRQFWFGLVVGVIGAFAAILAAIEGWRW